MGCPRYAATSAAIGPTAVMNMIDFATGEHFDWSVRPHTPVQ